MVNRLAILASLLIVAAIHGRAAEPARPAAPGSNETGSVAASVSRKGAGERESGGANAEAGSDASAPRRSEIKLDGADAEAKKSVARLPLDHVTGPHRERVLEILERPLLYRRGPIEAYPCKPDLLEWIMSNPVLVAEFWRQLGLLVSEIEPLEDGYQCRDGRTTIVRFHEVCRSPHLRIVYCAGEASRPPLPGKMRAEMVFVYRYHFARQTDGKYFVIQQMESFSTAQGATLRALMKLTRGMTSRLVDQSMQDMTIYFSLMCRIMQMRPTWTRDAIAKVRQRVPEADLETLDAIVAQLIADPVELPLPALRMIHEQLDTPAVPAAAQAEGNTLAR